MRQKKAEQKANQLAGKETDSDNKFETRPTPSVSLFFSISITFQLFSIIHLSL